MMRPVAVLVIAIAALVAGCDKSNSVNVVSSPYSSGQSHTEPVIYNGRPYSVEFIFRAAQDAYDVTVAGKDGRAIGDGDGNRKIVEQIGSSTVRHFACPDSKKAQIVPGTTRHGADKWQMQARCA